MKKTFLFLFFVSLLLGSASAAVPSISIDGRSYTGPAYTEDGTTYVALRPFFSALLPGASFSWAGETAQVRHSGLDMELNLARPYLLANSRCLYLPRGVHSQAGTLYLPLRTLAKAAGAEVTWDSAASAARITRGTGAILSGDAFYDADSLFWLSRIISAESRGEPLLGKIAVGNVVLNRVASDQFPNTIYDVIFDGRYGGQFEPVRNGTIYQAPTDESVLAAKLVLDGASVVGGSLYFLAPHLTSNHWMMENQTYVTTIGSHWFYQ